MTATAAINHILDAVVARLGLALVLLVACDANAIADSQSVRVWENHDDTAITEGETTLEIDPDTAYAAAIDYARWPAIFSDIVRVDITKQQGVDARVTLIHKDGNRDNVHFHNRPQGRLVWFEDTGGRAEVWVEIFFASGMRPGTTRVHSRLYADVHGWASLFVSGSRLRSLREQRITSDLRSLHAFFSAGGDGMQVVK
jgi:hypothetical protein